MDNQVAKEGEWRELDEGHCRATTVEVMQRFAASLMKRAAELETGGPRCVLPSTTRMGQLWRLQEEWASVDHWLNTLATKQEVLDAVQRVIKAQKGSGA